MVNIANIQGERRDMREIQFDSIQAVMTVRDEIRGVPCSGEPYQVVRPWPYAACTSSYGSYGTCSYLRDVHRLAQ